MLATDNVTAIYVPIALEHAVEEWIRKRYDVTLLTESPIRTRSLSSGRQTRSLSSCCRGGHSVAPPCGQSSRRLLARSPPMALLDADRRSTERRRTPARRSLSGSHLRSSPSRGDNVWTRLATPPRRFTCSSTEIGSEVPRTKSSARRKTIIPDGENSVFNRLYISGLSQQERHAKAFEEAQHRRVEEEDREIQRGKLLMRVLSTSDNYALKGKAFAEKLASAKEVHRYSDVELKEISNRLSKKRHSATVGSHPSVVTNEEREMTFHPKVSEPSHASRDGLQAHFNQLYMDGAKRDRLLRELRESYHMKERRIALERRMRSDVAFRKKVEDDPSFAAHYMRSL